MFDGYTGFILGVIGTTILSYLVNLTTPYFQPYVDKYVDRYWESRRLRSDKQKQKIDELVKQMELDQDFYINLRHLKTEITVYMMSVYVLAMILIINPLSTNSSLFYTSPLKVVMCLFFLSSIVYARNRKKDEFTAMRTYLKRKREKYNQNKD